MNSETIKTCTNKSISENLIHTLTNIFNINGRASRSEFWTYYIIWAILKRIVVIEILTTEYTILYFAISILFYPLIFGLVARRLHDLNKSIAIYSSIFALDIIMSLVSLNAIMTGDLTFINTDFSIINTVTSVYFLWLLLLFFKKGDRSSNKYGKSPYK